jgi:hypothetical protein
MLDIKILNCSKDFKDFYHCALKNWEPRIYYYYNEEIRTRNMPTSFPCIIVRFHEHLGNMAGYVPLYCIKYLNEELKKADFNIDEYLENFIKKADNDHPFVDRWNRKDLDVTALMEWNWSNLVRKERKPIKYSNSLFGMHKEKLILDNL